MHLNLFNYLKNNFRHLLIITNIFALLVIPGLNNVHYDPLPQFFAEISFVWLTLTLSILIIFSYKRVAIPIITIPLGLLAIFLILQQFFIPIQFVGLSYTVSLELLVLVIVAISINTLYQAYGIEKIFYYIAISLSLGVILQSLIALIQYLNLFKYFFGIIFYDGMHPNTSIFGHFGQRNHYCHYLSLGVFSLIYIYQKRKINSLVFASLILWLIFSMTIAGSRSVFIYFTLASIFSFSFYLITKQEDYFKIARIILLVTIVLVAFEYVFPHLQAIFRSNGYVQVGLERVINNNNGAGHTGRRLIEWKKAWIAFKSHPLSGIGLNEYAKEGVELHTLFKNSPLNSDGLFTNCHNLILQLLAETGITGALIVIIGIVSAIYKLCKLKNLESLILVCLISTTLSHSMVEYPLWYLYFLGPLIMFLSITPPLKTFESTSFALIMIVPLSLITFLIIQGTIIYNNLVGFIDTPYDEKTFVQQGTYLKNLVNHNILWAYPALYTLDNYIELNNKNSDLLFTNKEKIYYEEKFVNFRPYPSNLIKCAKLNWAEGNKAQAERLVKSAIVAFPVYKNSYLKSLKAAEYQNLKKLIF